MIETLGLMDGVLLPGTAYGPMKPDQHTGNHLIKVIREQRELTGILRGDLSVFN